MDKSKKRTLSQAKADMDLHVCELRKKVAHGEEAAERLPLVVDQLDATRKYLRTSAVYEVVRYEDGEQTLADLEHEVDLLNEDIKCAEVARGQLVEAERFYRAYHYVVNGPKIRALRRELTEAECWVEQWNDRIRFVDCDTEEDIDKCDQEKAHCEYELACAREKVCILQNKIRDLRNVRYM